MSETHEFASQCESLLQSRQIMHEHFEKKVTRLANIPVVITSVVDFIELVIVMMKINWYIMTEMRDIPKEQRDFLIPYQSDLLKFECSTGQLLVYNCNRVQFIEEVQRGLCDIYFPIPLLEIISSYVQMAFSRDKLSKSIPYNEQKHVSTLYNLPSYRNQYYKKDDTIIVTPCCNDMIIVTPCCNALMCSYQFIHKTYMSFLCEKEIHYGSRDCVIPAMPWIRRKYSEMKWQDILCESCNSQKNKW